MHGYALFLGLQAFILVPELIRAPWLWAIALLVLGLRAVCIYKQQAVGAIMKWLCIAAGLAGLLLAHSSFNVDSAADFLALVYLLKTLETKRQQETLYQLYLSILIIASGFLFYQGLLITVHGLLSVIAIVAYLHWLQHARGLLASWMFSCRLLLSALPLMLVAYALFPRLPPLWQVPPSSVAKTGLPEQMQTGDIAKLIQSDELVFRVRFADSPPKQEQLYWRALVLSQFDGRHWQADKPEKALAMASFDKKKTTHNYQVFLQANQTKRLYFLNQLSHYPSSQLTWHSDNTLTVNTPSHELKSVTLQSAVANSFAEKQIHTAAYLQLPEGNSKTQALLERWRQQGLHGMALVEKALSYFREQAFFYTLEPPLLTGERIDDFLFNSRKGFCEHYAASFVVMMRFAGIPARVVLGYQGGQVNPFDNSLAVRQLDAHAWAEVWLEGRWYRVDPTAAVAPERVLYSSEQLLSQDPNFFSDSLMARQKYQWQWFQRVSLRLQQWDFWWQSQMLGFDASRQKNLLKTLFGKQRYRNMLLSLLAFFGLLMLGFWWFIVRQSKAKTYSAEEKLLQKFLQRCQKANVAKKPQQGVYDFCCELTEKYPEKADEARVIAYLYNQLRYQKGLPPSHRLRLLRQLSHAVMHFRLP